MTDAAMNDQIQAMLDRSQIDQVLARYSRGVDRVDVGLIRSVYWDEAIDDHGSFTGNGLEFADYLGERMPKRHRATTHFVGKTYFASQDATQTRTETAFQAFSHPTANHEGYVIGGRYIDLFEKRGAEWRILHRVLAYDWSFTATFHEQTLGLGVDGGRAPADRSYGFFAGMEKMAG